MNLTLTDPNLINMYQIMIYALSMLVIALVLYMSRLTQKLVHLSTQRDLSMVEACFWLRFVAVSHNKRVTHLAITHGTRDTLSREDREAVLQVLSAITESYKHLCEIKEHQKDESALVLEEGWLTEVGDALRSMPNLKTW